jgi:hypothetical protein
MNIVFPLRIVHQLVVVAHAGNQQGKENEAG